MPFSSNETERQKQLAFYEAFLPRVDSSLSLDDILTDYSDGVLNGNLLEMKASIKDLNATLFQAIKYLSAFRIKGKSVPATILLIDLNQETAYVYNSKDYLKDIEKVYTSSASKDNAGFTSKVYKEKLQYGKKQKEAEALIVYLKKSNYTKIHIDENCIVGWAERYYRENPSARKEDFIGDETGKHQTLYSKRYYDKRSCDGDIPSDIYLGYDGTPARQGVKLSLKAVYNDNILGYMVIDGSNFDNPDLMAVLIRAGLYKGHGYYLRSDNYLEKLPMFCASRYITYNREWTERARIMKSADGAKRFAADIKSGKLKRWLNKCLLFTCLEMQNHIRTFTGSDGRFYRNELCLDDTNGDTLATKALENIKFTAREKKLIEQWSILLEAVKQTDEYNSELTYGVYQIYAEIDTSYKDENGNTIYNNLEVHSALQTLKTLVKDYYNKEIVPNLFKYEFLK